MIEYVLDTDICIYWLNGNPSVREKVIRQSRGVLAITMIAYAELKFGAYNSGRVAKNLENIGNFVKGVSVLPLTHESADLFGSLKADLRAKGEIIGDFDILIAAITRHFGATLVTNNTAPFWKNRQLAV